MRLIVVLFNVLHVPHVLLFHVIAFLCIVIVLDCVVLQNMCVLFTFVFCLNRVFLCGSCLCLQVPVLVHVGFDNLFFNGKPADPMKIVQVRIWIRQNDTNDLIPDPDLLTKLLTRKW